MCKPSIATSRPRCFVDVQAEQIVITVYDRAWMFFRTALPPANKLDSDRRLLLQQQLAGRWGSMDSVDTRAVVKEDRSDVQATNIVRSQVCIIQVGTIFSHLRKKSNYKL